MEEGEFFLVSLLLSFANQVVVLSSKAKGSEKVEKRLRRTEKFSPN